MAYRLSPLQPPYAPEIERALAAYPQRGGVLLSLFRTFANSLRFLRKGVANLLDDQSPLTLRQREIVILRVTARCGCEYEWGVHVAAFAKQAGLGQAAIAATHAQGAAAGCWSPDERLLLTAVDELFDAARLSEETRLLFEQNFTLEQQLEIIALCGNYHTICYVANVAGLTPEPFAARFPV